VLSAHDEHTLAAKRVDGDHRGTLWGAGHDAVMFLLAAKFQPLQPGHEGIVGAQSACQLRWR
jgi:hypothetical protein